LVGEELKIEKHSHYDCALIIFVAGVGFEPTTFGLDFTRRTFTGVTGAEGAGEDGVRHITEAPERGWGLAGEQARLNPHACHRLNRMVVRVYPA